MSQAVLRVVVKEDNDKKRALEAALSQIDRAFGKGSVMKLGQRERAVDADAVSTGSLGLDTGEQALEITDTLVRSGGVDIVVVDSVAALTPRAELEGEMGDQLPGLQARLMSQALRKLTGSIS